MKYLYDIIIMAVDSTCKNISKLDCWKSAKIGQGIFCPKVDQKTINETNNTVLSFKDTLKRFVKNLIDRKASMYNYEFTKKQDDALPSYDKYKHKLFALFSAKYAHYYVVHEKYNEENGTNCSQIQHKSSSVEFDFNAKYQQIGMVNSSYQEIQIKDVNGNWKNFQTKNTSGNDNSCLLHAIISTVNGLGVPSNFLTDPQYFVYHRWKRKSDGNPLTETEQYARYLRYQMIKELTQLIDAEGVRINDHGNEYLQLVNDAFMGYSADGCLKPAEKLMSDLKNNQMLDYASALLLLYMIEKNTGPKWRVIICSDRTGVVSSFPEYPDNENDKDECERTIVIHHRKGHFSAYKEENTKAK